MLVWMLLHLVQHSYSTPGSSSMTSHQEYAWVLQQPCWLLGVILIYCYSCAVCIEGAQYSVPVSNNNNLHLYGSSCSHAAAAAVGAAAVAAAAVTSDILLPSLCLC